MTNVGVVLCADDYGLGEGVSRGILKLAAMGRISATSVMTNGTAWPRFGPQLAGHWPTVAAGLHLTLTWGRPLEAMPDLAPSGAFPTLNSLLRRALTRRLDLGEIEAEIDRQLACFAVGLGAEPDFVDGHQHVHVLPGIREALFRSLGRRGLGGKVWLRNPAERSGAIVKRRVSAGKALFVGGLSAGFGAAAGRAGFEANAGFSGFSPFRPARAVGPDFERYLEDLGPAHLVMCHPGEDRGDAPADEIATARTRELDYLASDAFPELLRRRRIALVRSPSSAGRRSPADGGPCGSK